jgi:hypothetical protein
MLYIHVRASCPFLCSMSMSVLHVHVHDACAWPCCMSISVLHVHVHAENPCPCSMSMSVYWMLISMMHVHVHTTCPCSCQVYSACPCLHAACPCIMFCLFVRLANFLESHICTFSRDVRDSRWYFREKRFSLGIRFSQNNCETRLTENPSTNMKRQRSKMGK